MKAMILAAGFGTRLLPYTKTLPKPLFTLSGQPLLDRIICRLETAGFTSVMINTHHLNRKIEAFLSDRHYTIEVLTRHEPSILGTGGAIKNAADFFDDGPFLVINGDIVTDIDPAAVYAYHMGHCFPATLVFVDDPEINTVAVADDGFVVGFENRPCDESRIPWKPFTFTGIQVLDPELLRFIPDGVCFSIVDAYRHLLAAGGKIKAYIPDGAYWIDIGTPGRYLRAVFDRMAPEAFGIAFPGHRAAGIDRRHLAGDGSDRKWFRVTTNLVPDESSHLSSATSGGGASVASSIPATLILADHGLSPQDGKAEVEAFVAIGRHLYDKGLPVPRIYHYDILSGIVFLEDLGDMNLQNLVSSFCDSRQVRDWYIRIIGLLIKMSILGGQQFDGSWTCQSARYDRQVILEKECRYFTEAFLNGYLGLETAFEDLEEDFSDLADGALEFAFEGFMHRDMQSRNIMVKDNACFFIDFQGGRIGPLQYDLASLLIDPYVGLPENLRTHLLDICADRLRADTGVDPYRFKSGFACCALARNLQILGAFAFLSRGKGKTYFENYIPRALKTLKQTLFSFEPGRFERLKAIVKKIGKRHRA